MPLYADDDGVTSELERLRADNARLWEGIKEMGWNSHCGLSDCHVCRLFSLSSVDAPRWLRERERAVAERVRTGVAMHIRTSPKFEGQLTTPNDSGLLGRVAQDIENFDLDALLGGGE